MGIPVCFEGFEAVPFCKTGCLRRVFGVCVIVEGEVEEVGAPDEDAVGPDEVAGCGEGVVIVSGGDGEPHGALVEECAPNFLSEGDEAGGMAEGDCR